MFAHEFIRNALLAGTPIALACGAVGYFVVLRAQVFAGDALSHVAFTGALAAAAAGIDLRIGLFAATVLVAALLAAMGERAAADDVMIGIVFVWVLGLGVFFLDLFNRGVNGGNGTIAARTLFGSIFGLTHRPGATRSADRRRRRRWRCLAIARPLLFATIDPQVAAARGVPVGLLGAALPHPARHRRRRGHPGRRRPAPARTDRRPGRRRDQAHRPALSRRSPSPALFALASVWLGVTAAYLIASLPPSTAILGVASLIYLAAFVISYAGRSRGRVRAPRPEPADACAG